MKGWISLTLLLAVGCGPSEEKFQEEWPVEYCAYIEECAPEEANLESAKCIEFYTSYLADATTPEGCEYQGKKQARACLKEIEDATCDDEVFPACNEVYSGECDDPAEELSD